MHLEQTLRNTFLTWRQDCYRCKSHSSTDNDLSGSHFEKQFPGIIKAAWLREHGGEVKQTSLQSEFNLYPCLCSEEKGLLNQSSWSLFNWFTTCPWLSISSHICSSTNTVFLLFLLILFSMYYIQHCLLLQHVGRWNHTCFTRMEKKITSTTKHLTRKLKKSWTPLSPNSTQEHITIITFLDSSSIGITVTTLQLSSPRKFLFPDCLSNSTMTKSTFCTCNSR